MVDFSQLLRKPAGEAKKPQALPIGDYPGVIKSWTPVEAPQGKDYKLIIRFMVGLTGWPEDVEHEDTLQEGEAIDLSKRQLRRDFYDNRLDIVDDLIRSCGIDMTGKTYEEVFPEMIGAGITVEVQQYINKTSGDIGNQIGKLVGQDG